METQMKISQIAWISRFETNKASAEVEIYRTGEGTWSALVRIFEGDSDPHEYETSPEEAMASMLRDLEGMNLL